jgi:hypothetical protein
LGFQGNTLVTTRAIAPLVVTRKAALASRLRRVNGPIGLEALAAGPVNLPPDDVSPAFAIENLSPCVSDGGSSPISYSWKLTVRQPHTTRITPAVNKLPPRVGPEPILDRRLCAIRDTTAPFAIEGNGGARIHGSGVAGQSEIPLR